MKCAKLHLQERSRSRIKLEIKPDKPRRYCQKRLVNPEHEEDPRWNDVDRFYYNVENTPADLNETYNSVRVQQEGEDLFLSVQNIQFTGEVQLRKRPRTSFKYKTLTDGKKHRMFVKQKVDCEEEDPDRSSELTCYYFDDYAKYFISNERSRPSSAKSSIFLYGLSNFNLKENKAVQVDIAQAGEPSKTRRSDEKTKKSVKTNVKKECKEEIKQEIDESNIEETKIAFHKRGKRKSLTISRTESPATVQVIRVDVVCNYSCSSTMSDYEDNKKLTNANDAEEIGKKKEIVKMKNSHFSNKYLLTNTVKTLDENVSGGAKVTLLCKTFRLADRSKLLSRRKSSKTVKDVENVSKKVQIRI